MQTWCQSAALGTVRKVGVCNRDCWTGCVSTALSKGVCTVIQHSWKVYLRLLFPNKVATRPIMQKECQCFCMLMWWSVFAPTALSYDVVFIRTEIGNGNIYSLRKFMFELTGLRMWLWETGTEGGTESLRIPVTSCQHKSSRAQEMLWGTFSLLMSGKGPTWGWFVDVWPALCYYK